jgi:hypothetical protein
MIAAACLQIALPATYAPVQDLLKKIEAAAEAHVVDRHAIQHHQVEFRIAAAGKQAGDAAAEAALHDGQPGHGAQQVARCGFVGAIDFIAHDIGIGQADNTVDKLILFGCLF